LILIGYCIAVNMHPECSVYNFQLSSSVGKTNVLLIKLEELMQLLLFQIELTRYNSKYGAVYSNTEADKLITSSPITKNNHAPQQ